MTGEVTLRPVRDRDFSLVWVKVNEWGLDGDRDRLWMAVLVKEELFVETGVWVIVFSELGECERVRGPRVRLPVRLLVAL